MGDSSSGLLWTVGGVLVGILLFWTAAETQRDFRPEDFGLGLNTVTMEERSGGLLISAHQTSKMAELVASFRAVKARGHKSVLWLGASQLHAVNQPHEGDHLAVYYANAAAAARSANLKYLQFSLPNANLLELFGAYLYFRNAGCRPDLLVIAFVYDDLNEEGVRTELAAVLPEISPDFREEVGDGAMYVAELQTQREMDNKQEAASGLHLAVKGTTQERLEEYIQAALVRHWPAYAHRGRLDARIRTELLTDVRPFVLTAFRSAGVPARRLVVDRDVRRRNEAALESLIRLCRGGGVPVPFVQATAPAG